MKTFWVVAATLTFTGIQHTDAQFNTGVGFAQGQIAPIGGHVVPQQAQSGQFWQQQPHYQQQQQPQPQYQQQQQQSFTGNYNNVNCQNDCCYNRPGGRCYTRALRRSAFQRRRLFGSKIKPSEADFIELEDDPHCNNELLRKVIKRRLANDVDGSKRAIHEEAEFEMGGRFAVVCTEADGQFAYVATTGVYCVEGNKKVTCYAFQYS